MDVLVVTALLPKLRDAGICSGKRLCLFEVRISGGAGASISSGRACDADGLSTAIITHPNACGGRGLAEIASAGF
jgi:hypothetical protein